MSQSMSTIVLVGRLTRDAELKYLNSGDAICHFSIATDTRVKKGDAYVDEPSFWEVDLWGKRGESVNQYLSKGKLVAVSGSASIERWEHDGKQFSKVKVNANDVQLLGSKPEGQATQEGQQAPLKQSPAAQAQAADDFTDNIPF